MTRTWARTWFLATAVCALAGVAISVAVAVHTTGGRFHNGVERGFNTLAFFTVQSNLLVAVGAASLALNERRSGTVFRVVRLMGLVAITVTGVVYHVALSGLLDLESWALVGDQLVHTVVPVLAVVGWLRFGPRGLTSARVAWASLLFPVAWLAFTLIRGAVVHWYPYFFIDVSKLGYGKAVLNCAWVSVLLLGLAAGATVVDGALRGRGGAATSSSSA